MGFGSRTRSDYREAELNFMQQVANQVAVAVDNVLHDESAQSAQQLLTRERDRLRLLLEVNNAVVSHLDLDDVFNAVSGCLRRVIPHDGSSLLLTTPRPANSASMSCASDRTTASSRKDESTGSHAPGRQPASPSRHERTALFSEQELGSWRRNRRRRARSSPKE